MMTQIELIVKDNQMHPGYWNIEKKKFSIVMMRKLLCSSEIIENRMATKQELPVNKFHTFIIKISLTCE